MQCLVQARLFRRGRVVEDIAASFDADAEKMVQQIGSRSLHAGRGCFGVRGATGKYVDTSFDTDARGSSFFPRRVPRSLPRVSRRIFCRKYRGRGSNPRGCGGCSPAPGAFAEGSSCRLDGFFDFLPLQRLTIPRCDHVITFVFLLGIYI